MVIIERIKEIEDYFVSVEEGCRHIVIMTDLKKGIAEAAKILLALRADKIIQPYMITARSDLMRLEPFVDVYWHINDQLTTIQNHKKANSKIGWLKDDFYSFTKEHLGFDEVDVMRVLWPEYLRTPTTTTQENQTTTDPIPAKQSQESLILDSLAVLGYDAQALIVGVGKKAGAKAEVWQKIRHNFDGRGSFNYYWKKLKADGRIADK